MTWCPLGRCGSSSLVAFWAGVWKSSVPPMSSVGTFEFGTVVYWSSPGLAGQACTRPPAPQMKSARGLPMIEPRSAPEL